jgi:hypothetical protein
MANIRFPRDNMDAATDPGAGDDVNDQYGPFSRWYNTVNKTIWLCENPAAGAAIWTRIGPPPHPFLGSGFEWLHFEDGSTIWDDESGTDPAELTEAEDIRRCDLIEGTSGRYMYDQTGNTFLYSPSTNAIDGYPTVYTRANSGSSGMDLKLSGAAVPASTFLAGRNFTLVAVVRNVATINNQRIFHVGSNSPMNSQWLTGNVFRLFGFVPGFVTADTSPWAAGKVRVLQCRWNETTSELETRINLGSWVASSGATTSWSPDAGSIQIRAGNMDIATWGLYDGNYGSIDTLVTDLMDYYPSTSA